MGGVKASAIIVFPNHVALMRRLLMEAHGKEGEFTYEMAMLRKEIMDLECKVQDLVAQHDRKSSLKKEEQKLFLLQ